MKGKGGEYWLPDFGDGGEAKWRRFRRPDGDLVTLATLLMLSWYFRSFDILGFDDDVC